MRNLNLLQEYRSIEDENRMGGIGDQTCGIFRIKSKIDFKEMFIIASSSHGWDHVSVSKAKRCPLWGDMCHIKDLFFNDDEVVMQLHVATKDWVNNHANCLHLWRPQTTTISTPPSILVGIKEIGVLP